MVIAYIAEKRYPRPDFQIEKEMYVVVKKGMVAQRALNYSKIESSMVLLLDNDVWLAPDSTERIFLAMESYEADAVGLDVFQNHELSLKTKLWTAVSNKSGYSSFGPNGHLENMKTALFHT